MKTWNDGDIVEATITHETEDIVNGWGSVIRSYHFWKVHVVRAYPSYRPDRSGRDWHASTLDEAVATLARVTAAGSDG